MPPLAIVGIGSLFPKAEDLQSFWANIKEGVDAITEVPDSHWDPADYFSEDQKKPDFTYAKRGGFLPPIDFEPMKYGMPPNALEATDTSQLLGMVVAERAMNDAGYGKNRDFDHDDNRADLECETVDECSHLTFLLMHKLAGRKSRPLSSVQSSQAVKCVHVHDPRCVIYSLKNHWSGRTA